MATQQLGRGRLALLSGALGIALVTGTPSASDADALSAAAANCSGLVLELAPRATAHTYDFNTSARADDCSFTRLLPMPGAPVDAYGEVISGVVTDTADGEPCAGQACWPMLCAGFGSSIDARIPIFLDTEIDPEETFRGTLEVAHVNSSSSAGSTGDVVVTLRGIAEPDEIVTLGTGVLQGTSGGCGDDHLTVEGHIALFDPSMPEL